MTSKVIVTSHNYPVLVQVLDREPEPHQFEEHAYESAPDGKYKIVEERVIKPVDGEVQFYTTTTRMLKITDLEYDDPRAK